MARTDKGQGAVKNRFAGSSKHGGTRATQQAIDDMHDSGAAQNMMSPKAEKVLLVGSKLYQYHKTKDAVARGEKPAKAEDKKSSFEKLGDRMRTGEGNQNWVSEKAQKHLAKVMSITERQSARRKEAAENPAKPNETSTAASKETSTSATFQRTYKSGPKIGKTETVRKRAK